jgi:hypothetical protein
MSRNVPVNKLKIKAIKKGGVPISDLEYTALVNPTKYDVGYTVQLCDDSPHGTQNSPLRFDRMLPADLKIDLFFDSTGSLGIETLNPRGVQPEIERFLQVAYDVDEEKLEPNLLVVLWGQLVYPCRLTAVSFTYTHFDFGGNPCRGTAACTFKRDGTVSRDKSKVSPKSTTKKAAITAGTTLAQIAALQTGSSSSVVAIAAVNKLKSLRGPLSVPESLNVIIPGDLTP